jgi:membrane protein
MTGILVLMAAIAGLPALVAVLDLGSLGKWLVTGLTWIGLAVGGLAGLAAIYRYGPSREDARWEWISWGSVLTLCLILVTSMLFSWYLASFADYNKTYGSLGALVGLLMWMWIMVVLVLVGGELNAEVEHQTSKDTTTGSPQPMGRRGATMADTVGRASR